MCGPLLRTEVSEDIFALNMDNVWPAVIFRTEMSEDIFALNMDNTSVFFFFSFFGDVFPLQCILTCLCVFYRKWHSHLVSSLWMRHAAICPSPSGTCYRWVDIPCLCVLFVSNTDSFSNCNVKWQRVPDRRAKMREGTITFHFVLIDRSNA